MKLLVFAHRAEAQAFLSKIPFKKQEGIRVDYYHASSIELGILICSEGVDESLKNLTYLLTYLESQNQTPSSIINMGVAGSINPKLKVSSIYSVRTSYRFLDSTPVFKSQTSLDPKAHIDCVTTNQRIVSTTDAKKLQVHADLVDRELWGITQACRLFKLPFTSYKLISDYAGETDCELIANKGNEYSFELFNYFNHLQEKEGSENTQKIFTVIDSKTKEFIDKLSPTFSHRVQIERLFEACAKRELETSHVLKVLSDEVYKDWPRKKRNQFIIKLLTQIADPVQAKLNTLCSKLSSLSCKALPNTEDPTVEIRAKISQKSELDQLIGELQCFPIEKLENFYQGNLDV